MSEFRLGRWIIFGATLFAVLAFCAVGPLKAVWSEPTLQGQANSPASQRATATPNAISTSVISSVATIPPALLARLPKDEQGRVIGGPLVPYLNYSPTMITGKKCPRLTIWTWKVINLEPPLRPYGQVNDPCVIQNAVDDFVRTEFADPAVNTPESMKRIEPLYATDPAILDGLMPAIRDSYLKFYRDGKTPYYLCDKPRFKLLDVSPRSPLVANNDGKVSGKAIQLTVYVVSQNVEPFTCQLLSLTTNKRIGTLTKTAAQLQGKQRVLQVNLLWNATKARWAVYDFGAAEVDNFYRAAKALWDAAPIKP
jgi:hypothetical protein